MLCICNALDCCLEQLNCASGVVFSVVKRKGIVFVFDGKECTRWVKNRFVLRAKGL